MALKVELKPGERIIIGNSLVTNGDSRTQLMIEGEAPILREKDVLTPQAANTPCRRVYLAVQLMYLENDIARFQETYDSLCQELATAIPRTMPLIEAVNNWILTGNLYKALKEAKTLLALEEEILQHAQRSPSL